MGHIWYKGLSDMMVWDIGFDRPYYDPLVKKRSILHYPPLHSTLTLSKNTISKIYLWINLWITVLDKPSKPDILDI